MPPTFADRLEDHGDRPALVLPDGTVVSYAELAARADAAADELGARPGRRLVLLEATNTLASVTTYLGCLRRGHPVAVVPPGRGAAIAATFAPEVVVADGALPHRPGPTAGGADALHPDLAVLLSTSGSTGSPKLVRLSAANVDANARAIATYLELTPDDRAVTSLPMAYCYGLSVLHSHLACGASVLLTDRSVAEPAFWSEARAAAVTTLAGVPHTFALLDRIGFAEQRPLPSLRVVTQAGGRLAAEAVRRYARLGRAQGWRFFVMYGQTEATARMAYLPPDEADAHPTAIGRPIEGGSFRLDDPGPDGVGELVYRGPNVMLGYATSRADLALGRTVDELRTGDLGRRLADDLYEVVGRRHRFVKPFGLRIDLDAVERALAAAGLEAWCDGSDETGVAVAVRGDEVRAARVVQRATGLPPGAVAAVAVAELPRLHNGKPDHAAVRRLVEARRRPEPDGGRHTPGSATTVARLYADALGRTVDALAPDDTFTGLGGDSLSYVELSVRLEERLGTLPDDWPDRSIGELEAMGTGTGTGTRATAATTKATTSAAVETTVVLRAAAIVLVVATHAGAFTIKGGAHLLLAIAGWNFARFQLPLDRRRLGTSLRRIVAPSVAWLALLYVLSDDYGLSNLLLVHTQTGSPVWDQRWRYWFVEALAQILVVTGAALSIPVLRRFERRRPFTLPALALGATLVLREVADHHRTFHRPQTVAWLFVLGWLAQRARTTAQRVAVSVAAGAAVHGFFHQPLREAVVVAGVLLLLWCRTLPVPRAVARPVGLVAASSLAVYLVHWQVYPFVRPSAGSIGAVVVSVAAGVALHVASGTIRTKRRSVERPAVALARWTGDERGAHAATG